MYTFKNVGFGSGYLKTFKICSGFPTFKGFYGFRTTYFFCPVTVPGSNNM